MTTIATVIELNSGTHRETYVAQAFDQQLKTLRSYEGAVTRDIAINRVRASYNSCCFVTPERFTDILNKHLLHVR